MIPVAAASTSSLDEPQAPMLFAQPFQQRVLCALLLAGATLLLYNPVSRFQFINYDDDEYVTDNSHVQSGLRWDNVRWAFTSFEAVNWHPMTWLSHMLDCQLFGVKAGGHHYVNVLLHALNAVLLFVLLHIATGKLGRSLMVAALFALHPLNVGSVAWIAERKNMISTLFWWLAIAAYGWYVRRPSKHRYLFVAVLFALGLMAKPMVITLPVVLLLLDYWPLGRIVDQRSFRLLALEKLPLFLLSAASAGITIYVQRSGGAVRSTTIIPIGLRLQNVVVSYAKYLYKAAWPVRLSIFYPFSKTPFPLWQLCIAALLIGFATFAALRWRRAHPYLLTGWFWYLITLLPVIGIIQVGDQAMADRYAYLPLIGFFIAVVWLGAELPLSRVGGVARVAIAMVVLVALAADSRRQLMYWQSSVTLFTRAAEVNPRDPVAFANLGEAYDSLGDRAAAHQAFQAVLKLDPNSPLPHYDIAVDLQRQHDFTSALKEYQFVINRAQMSQDAGRLHLLGHAYNNAGLCLRELHRDEEAKRSFQGSIAADPRAFRGYLNLGETLESEGSLDDAAAAFEQSIKVAPTPMAYYDLGKVRERQNRWAEAISAFRGLLQISPDNPAAEQEISVLQKKLHSNP